MTPFDRLKAGSDKLQNSGCEAETTVQKVRQDYEKQADEADQRLQEKQAQEQERLFGRS